MDMDTGLKSTTLSVIVGSRGLFPDHLCDIMEGGLHADLGRAAVVLLREETERHKRLTTPQWPIMHAGVHGVTRDQMMACHKANHINVAYASSAERADQALATKAAQLHAMGLQVHLCGKVALG
jgi:hypothetical protein